jgi:uncharacterized protein YgiB involved in biofilm formation
VCFIAGVKRSTAVALVLSGALVGGCGRREEPAPEAALRSPQVVTNDTYVEGRGYYHAPFHAWYPFPYNFYSPGLGYYRGGAYHAQPDLTNPKPTTPAKVLNTAPRENVARGGFTRSSGSRSGWGGYRSSGS